MNTITGALEEETEKKIYEAVRQLVAGAAHELNNPLMAIMGFTQLLIDSGGFSPQQQQDIEGINRQSLRCRDIIQSLLQLSQKNEPRKESTRVTRLLKESVRMVKYDYRLAGIKLDIDLPSNLPPIFVDPNQLQQVFLNMLAKARYAMENVEKKHLEIRVGQEDKRIVVDFIDNGRRSPSENLGLGLSISVDLIRQNGGEIRMEVQAGAGTKFTIDLPVYEAKGEHSDEKHTGC